MSGAVLLAIPRDFLWQGQVYKVCIRDFATEIAFAEWVKMEAGLTLARLRPRWPADFWMEQNRLLSSKIIGKQIQWGSEDVHQAVWSEEGIRHMLFLKMQRGAELEGGEVPTRELIDAIAADTTGATPEVPHPKYDELIKIMLEQDWPQREDAEKNLTSRPASNPPPASPLTPKV